MITKLKKCMIPGIFVGSDPVSTVVLVGSPLKLCEQLADLTGRFPLLLKVVQMNPDRLRIIGNHLQPSVTMASSGQIASPLTTHILDTARGTPATNVPITVSSFNEGQTITIAQGVTNSDGRCPGLLTPEQFTRGTYQIHFDTKSYFASLGTKAFYPRVDVTFEIEDSSQHYHVPLLLSPYGFSTYRGS